MLRQQQPRLHKSGLSAERALIGRAAKVSSLHLAHCAAVGARPFSRSMDVARTRIERFTKGATGITPDKALRLAGSPTSNHLAWLKSPALRGPNLAGPRISTLTLAAMLCRISKAVLLALLLRRRKRFIPSHRALYTGPATTRASDLVLS